MVKNILKLEFLRIQNTLVSWYRIEVTNHGMDRVLTKKRFINDFCDVRCFEVFEPSVIPRSDL